MDPPAFERPGKAALGGEGPTVAERSVEKPAKEGMRRGVPVLRQRKTARTARRERRFNVTELGGKNDDVGPARTWIHRGIHEIGNARDGLSVRDRLDSRADCDEV